MRKTIKEEKEEVYCDICGRPNSSGDDGKYDLCYSHRSAMVQLSNTLKNFDSGLELLDKIVAEYKADRVNQLLDLIVSRLKSKEVKKEMENDLR